MIKWFIFLFGWMIYLPGTSDKIMEQQTISYVALGDSYTIGEGVPLQENFPYQAVQLLRRKNQPLYAPEIIAKTGWTTDELSTAIAVSKLLPRYDIVSLLIGVNNQYRGRTATEYATEFEGLLKQAIGFAGNDSSHVFVLSIPDWSVTPFAEDRNRVSIATEIDAYNIINKRISLQYGVHYIDITASTRLNGVKPGFLAADGLHPSGKEYAVWAQQLADAISITLSK
jgi:lysophospholipase L1-like esterase